MAAAIAMAESGGNSDAVSRPNTDGSIDRGLFQINSIHGAPSTTAVEPNVRYAIQLSKNGNHWTPWTVFKTGAYRKYFDGQGSLVGESVVDVPSPGLSIPNPLGDIATALAAIVAPATLLMKVGPWISDPKNMIRVAQVVFGGVLGIVGIALLNLSLVKEMSDEILPIAKSVATKGMA